MNLRLGNKLSQRSMTIINSPKIVFLANNSAMHVQNIDVEQCIVGASLELWYSPVQQHRLGICTLEINVLADFLQKVDFDEILKVNILECTFPSPPAFGVFFFFAEKTSHKPLLLLLLYLLLFPLIRVLTYSPDKPSPLRRANSRFSLRKHCPRFAGPMQLCQS